MDRVHPDAPPFIIPQGDKDTMAPVQEARAFVDLLRSQSSQRVVYMEFPGAQHIFDLGFSHQSAQMIEGVLSVLEEEYRAYLGSPPFRGEGRADAEGVSDAGGLADDSDSSSPLEGGRAS